MTSQFRRAATLAAAALLATGLAGCATMKAGSHVERGAEFRQYRTWEWAADEAKPTGDPRLDSNTMFEERVRAAVEHQLTRKGYVRAPIAGAPDLMAHYHMNFSKTFEVTGGVPPGGSCTRDCEPEAYAYEHGTLVVDLVDTRTSQLVWRGWSWDNMQGVVDRQEVMDREIDRAVAALFQQCPEVR